MFTCLFLEESSEHPNKQKQSKETRYFIETNKK